MSTETAEIQVNKVPAPTWAARLIGVLTIGWVYSAYTDLRWLLHLHAVHILVTRAPFSFSYYPYLACNIANVAASVSAVCLLLIFPSRLFRVLTPGSGRPVNGGWFTGGIITGLILLELGVYTILSSLLWTVYRSGKNEGWQLDVTISTLVAMAGIYLCRKVLAGRCDA